MACAFDGGYQLPLMFGAGSRDTLGDYFSLLGDKSLEAFFVLVVNVHLLGIAETTGPFFPGGLSFFVPS